MRFKSREPKLLHNDKSPLDKERADSLVEFAIAIPLIIILLFGVIESGFALNTYLNLTQVTREGVLMASRTPHLKGSHTTPKGAVSWQSSPHMKIHKKLRELIQNRNIAKWFNATPVITTSRKTLNQTPSNAIEQEIVKVSIEGEYKGWLIFKGFVIKSEDTGPYLLRD